MRHSNCLSQPWDPLDVSRFTRAQPSNDGWIHRRALVDQLEARWFLAAQLPYPNPDVPAAIPGTIQVENFDSGGQEIAFNDTTPENEGGMYRTGDGVDLEPAADAGGGTNVGWTLPGEWLEYTVNIPTAGTYDLRFRVASDAGGGTFHVEMDGNNVSGTVIMPNTDGWQKWTTVSKRVSLPAGKHVMCLSMDAASSVGTVGNFNWIKIERVSPGTNAAFDNGTLRVTGTTGADNIAVSALYRAHLEVSVYSGGSVIWTNTASQEKVLRINVSAGDGNDIIAVTADKNTAPLNVYGDAGNDTIKGSAFYSAAMELNGGAGNDTFGEVLSNGSIRRFAFNVMQNGKSYVRGGLGDDNILVQNAGGPGAEIRGDDGNDKIKLATFSYSGYVSSGFRVRGGAGKDFIRGGALADTLIGDEGSDSIYGGAGNDMILAGHDADFLFGEDGDDFLDTGYGYDDAAYDKLDGGAGTDTAILGKWDNFEMVGIEDVVA